MRKTLLFLTVLVLVAAPALACGFPLPAGTTMMRISKAECAQGEATDSCQTRQDAYQLMGKLQTAHIPDLSVEIVSGVQGSEGTIAVQGSLDYVVTDASEGLGADIHLWVEKGIVDMGGAPTTLDGSEMIVSGSKVYTSEDGGKTWDAQDLTEDQAKFFSILVGVGGQIGAGLDMYMDPTTFSVTAGKDEEIDGQAMTVQTLSLDINALLSSPATLGQLMTDAFAAGGPALGLTEDNLGMPVESFASQAALLAPLTTGSSVDTTIYIGQEDGYIHYVEENYVMSLAIDASGPMTGSYKVSGHITDHNSDITVKAPANATEGGSGLGSSLFGNGLGQ